CHRNVSPRDIACTTQYFPCKLTSSRTPLHFLFFKQKTAYEIGLGIPAEPLFRSDLVHQQTQNQRYGSSHIGATAKDISNVVTDAASGVVDIFHGIDKAVADTWNNFWKDGKADGIGSNLSRK